VQGLVLKMIKGRASGGPAGPSAAQASADDPGVAEVLETSQ
jgi:hypothetical protein